MNRTYERLQRIGPFVIVDLWERGQNCTTLMLQPVCPPNLSDPEREGWYTHGVYYGAHVDHRPRFAVYDARDYTVSYQGGNGAPRWEPIALVPDEGALSMVIAGLMMANAPSLDDMRAFLRDMFTAAEISTTVRVMESARVAGERLMIAGRSGSGKLRRMRDLEAPEVTHMLDMITGESPDERARERIAAYEAPPDEPAPEPTPDDGPPSGLECPRCGIEALAGDYICRFCYETLQAAQ